MDGGLADFVKCIRQRRMKMVLSIPDLAVVSGVSESVLSQIELGHCPDARW
jgi:transcriptional regulator with XRE-family HTH domain